MTLRLRTARDLERELAELVRGDPRLADVLVVGGRPRLRTRSADFAGLASIVVAQQLSTASAAAIWQRLATAFDPLDHHAVLRARAARLARAGLSTPKIRTLKALAKAIARDALDLSSLAHMPADDAHAALVAVHGIGPWTADIFLLFCLGHADAWPAGDLALQEAARVAFALPERPTAKAMVALAEPWRPRRGVAAKVLWSYYAAVKGRDAVPVTQKTERR